MAGIIRIKRSLVQASPASLLEGEVAYSFVSKTLFIGGPNNTVVPIGGESFAKVDSPEFTGVPKAPTAPPGTNNTQLATTAFVAAAMATAGTGDMLKSVYDTNNTGRVDTADNSLQLNGVSAASYARVDTDTNFTTPPTVGGVAISLVGHSHSAEDITSGVFDIARIPVLPSSVQIVSSGAIADLTPDQQDEIGDGSIVTTTDGRRWVYTGSGSKTLESSYVELADITPDWSTISNKPAFGTLSTLNTVNNSNWRGTALAVANGGTGATTQAQARTNLGLGSIATQNADAVSITGGTIDGVTFDGGTF